MAHFYVPASSSAEGLVICDANDENLFEDFNVVLHPERTITFALKQERPEPSALAEWLEMKAPMLRERLGDPTY